MQAPRVVTLIASATEIVSALGLCDQIVGISHECDYPPEIEGLPRLSAPKINPELTSAAIDRDVRKIVRDGLSVYRVNVEELKRLKPDVIVTQDHCEVCAVSLSDVEEALCALHLPATRVLSLHPEDLADVRNDLPENFQEAFANFEVEELARFNRRNVERLMKNAGIVRHRGKIESAILA